MAASGNLLQRGVLELGMCSPIPGGGGGWSARQDIWGGRTGVRWVVWEQARKGGWLFRRYGCDFVFFLASTVGRPYPHCKVDIMLMRISDSTRLALPPPATPCSLVWPHIAPGTSAAPALR